MKVGEKMKRVDIVFALAVLIFISSEFHYYTNYERYKKLKKRLKQLEIADN